VGFFYGLYNLYVWDVNSRSYVSVKNHGIPEETIQGALSASKDFFSLLLETKMEARHLARI